MENYIYFIGFIAFVLTAILVIVFKVFRFLYKFNKLYNFFIKSTDSIESKSSFTIKEKGLPPINGECPTKEELENLD